jgi:hypothetical protein
MDAGNNRVLRYDPGSNNGITVATASFNTPRGMRLDSVGNLYVTDLSHRVIKFPCGNSHTNAYSYSIELYSFFSSIVYNATTTTLTTTIPTTVTTITRTSSTTTTTLTPPSSKKLVLIF